MRKLISLVLPAIVAAVLVAGGRWYMYVSNTSELYDETGIALMSIMPAPVRDWGCGKLHANFPNALPPISCVRGNNPKEWVQ